MFVRLLIVLLICQQVVSMAVQTENMEIRKNQAVSDKDVIRNVIRFMPFGFIIGPIMDAVEILQSKHLVE